MNREEKEGITTANSAIAEKTKSVFLDQWKFRFGKRISTLTWCLAILGTIATSSPFSLSLGGIKE